MNEYDIIALGELNVDLLLNNIAGFPEIGKEIIAENMSLSLGSSTAIFAANASSLGSKVAFLGTIGKDNFGRFIRKSLQDCNVDTSFLIEIENVPTGITVILNYGNDRANVTYPGTMNHLGVDLIEKKTINKAKHIHISSIYLQKKLLEDLYSIVKIIKDQGKTISIDTQWDPSEKWDFDYKKILPMVDVFMPNEQELMCLTGKNNIEDAIEEVRAYINIMAVKMGTKGSIVIAKDGYRKELPSFLNDKVVDAIGAGDSFNSGFLSSFVKGKDLQYCQWLGNLAGAINTTGIGGTSAFSSKKAIIETAKNKFSQTLQL